MFDVQDEELVKSIKDWWKKNSKFIFIFIFLLGVIFSGRTIWNKQNEKNINLSSEYLYKINLHIQANSLDKANQEFLKLNNEQPDSSYTQIASLFLTKKNFSENKIEESQRLLLNVVQNSKSKLTQSVARLRLSNIFMDQKKHDKALDILNYNFPDSFKPLALDLSGDIYFLMKNIKKAKEMYVEAIETYAIEDTWFSVLKLKLDLVDSI